MASAGKKKTTMAKMARESRLRERRLDKAARKDARKRNAAESGYDPYGTVDEAAGPDVHDGDGDVEAADGVASA